MCSKCKDQGKECPGKHPLVEVTTDANATAPVAPEDEPIFPISDASEQFKEDDHETSVRALFLASLLGHDDIVSQIVQWGTGMWRGHKSGDTANICDRFRVRRQYSP